MDGQCVYVPEVNGKPSETYLALRKATGNRKLTNYLYALVTSDTFKLMCSPKDENSQGEPSIEAIDRILNLLEFVRTEDAIKLAELRIGSKNSAGDYVLFDEIDTIFDLVQEINEDPDSKIRAIIRFNSEGKYYVVVEGINDSNFMIGEMYKAYASQFDTIKDYLIAQGFNLDSLSDKSKMVLNKISSYYGLDTLKKFANLKYEHYISSALAALILDLFKNTSEIQRFLLKFGNNINVASEALSFLLKNSNRNKYEIPVSLKPYETVIQPMLQDVTTGNNGLIQGIRTLVSNKIKTADLRDLDAKFKELYGENVSDENVKLKDDLKKLCEKWNLDVDAVYQFHERVNSVEELCNLLIHNLSTLISVLEARGQLTDKEQEQIARLRDMLEKKEYAHSIIEYLQQSLEIIPLLESLKEQTQLDTDDLGTLDALSKTILAIKLEIAYNINTLRNLRKLSTLKDAEDLTDEDINLIEDLTKQLSDKYATWEDEILDMEFALVKKFLKLYWGKATDDEDIDQVMEDMLKGNQVRDINLYDRWLAAFTETSDRVLSTLGFAIKKMHRERDDKIEELRRDINRAAHRLHQSGSNSTFMYEQLTDNDNTVKILSRIDWNAFYKARAEKILEYKNRGYSRTRISNSIAAWEEKNLGEYHTGIIDPTTGEEIVVYNVPNEDYRKEMPVMSTAQEEYYKSMLILKYNLEKELNAHGVKTSLFTPVLITSDALTDVATGNNIIHNAKERFKEIAKVKLDDTEFGNHEVAQDGYGNEVKKLPVFYILKLKDQRRLSRDFSGSMLAFASMVVNYGVTADRINIFELTKDFLMERRVLQESGDRKLVTKYRDMTGLVKVTPLTKPARETRQGIWLNDVYDAKIYGMRHKREKSLGEFSVPKIADAITTYTSVTGLAANLPGAIANMLVGKLQMFIECGAREFFNYKDMSKAVAKYWAWLPPLLGEVASNDRKSKLGLLMRFYDVTDDIYDEMKRTGFYTNPIHKIIGNTSLMFMYGMGEHLLHAQGMLACLIHEKCKDSTGTERSILDAFDVNVVDGNGELTIKKGFTDLDGNPLTVEYMKRFRERITYVNGSMHGLFGADEKGLIHMYAVGRLIMNFRQWMPAHYARRFNKRHWDATLQQYREGYYVTTGKFVWRLLKDMKKTEFHWITRYNQLNAMEKANMRRMYREVFALVILFLLSGLSFGDDPKHRSWIESLIKYEIRRMYMETSASCPVNLAGFISNFLKTLNSPMAAISSALKLTMLFGIDDLITGKTIQTGPNAGKLKYWRNWEKAIPFYDQVLKWLNMDTDDSMFVLFR